MQTLSLTVNDHGTIMTDYVPTGRGRKREEISMHHHNITNATTTSQWIPSMLQIHLIQDLNLCQL